MDGVKFCLIAPPPFPYHAVSQRARCLGHADLESLSNFPLSFLPLTFTITSGRHQFHSTIFSSVIVVTVLVQHELAPCSVCPVLPDRKSVRLACTFTVQSFLRLPQAKSGEIYKALTIFAASRRRRCCCCVESVWKSSPTSWQPLRLRSGLVLVSRCNLL